MQYTPQQLEERYQKLPPPLKDAVVSPDTADKIFEIGKKNGLNLEQIGILAEETGRIILGLTRPEDFAAVLKNRLQSADGVSQTIAAEVNHQILFPLRDILKSAHQMDIKDSPVSDIPEFMKGLKPMPEYVPGEIKNQPPVIGPETAKPPVISPNIIEIPKKMETATLAPVSGNLAPTIDLRQVEKNLPKDIPPAVGAPTPIKPPIIDLREPIQAAPKPELVPVSGVKPAPIQIPAQPPPAPERPSERAGSTELNRANVKKQPAGGVDTYREPIEE